MRRWMPWMCLSLIVGCDDGGGSDRPEERPDAGIEAPDGGGELPDAGPGMADAGAEADAAILDDMGPPPITASRFDPPTPWARPIEDYLAAGVETVGPEGAFERGIHDLVAFDDRLFIGYGDATVNLGRVTPIELRAFTDPEDAEAVAAEFASDEEQIDRYRIIDGALYQAGIDATEDAWLGNVYRRAAGGEWVKHRSVYNGVHVHDVLGFGGALYAVGSGATQEEWQSGHIYGHLWRSEDEGGEWSIVDRVHNGLVGDTRWVRLLVGGDDLYMFGYRSDREGQIYDFPTGVLAANGNRVDLLPDDHALGQMFAIETDQIAPTVGLLRGVDVAARPLRYQTWTLDGDGPRPVEALAGMTTVDVALRPETGEVLLLTHDEDDFQTANGLTEWTVRVHAAPAGDLSALTELFSFETAIRPRAVAWWRGGIYYGDDDGAVWRTLGQ